MELLTFRALSPRVILFVRIIETEIWNVRERKSGKDSTRFSRVKNQLDSSTPGVKTINGQRNCPLCGELDGDIHILLTCKALNQLRGRVTMDLSLEYVKKALLVNKIEDLKKLGF